MSEQGCSWRPHGMQGCSWRPHCVQGCSWRPHGMHGCSCRLHGVHGCSWRLHGVQECSWRPHGVQGYAWRPRGMQGCSWRLYGMQWWHCFDSVCSKFLRILTFTLRYDKHCYNPLNWKHSEIHTNSEEYGTLSQTGWLINPGWQCSFIDSGVWKYKAPEMWFPVKTLSGMVSWHCRRKKKFQKVSLMRY